MFVRERERERRGGESNGASAGEEAGQEYAVGWQVYRFVYSGEVVGGEGGTKSLLMREMRGGI